MTQLIYYLKKQKWRLASGLANGVVIVNDRVDQKQDDQEKHLLRL